MFPTNPRIPKPRVQTTKLGHDLALILCSVFLTVTVGKAQNEILYYKFDAGDGSKVINYAAGNGPAPNEGRIVGNEKKPWASGRFGGSLKGGDNRTTKLQNYLDTGWNGAFKGDFTIAWFMKRRVLSLSELSYFFSGVGFFRCFTNGVAGRGLLLRNWGPTSTHPDLRLYVDVVSAATRKWLHVAIVVDSRKRTAIWYVNALGKPAIQLPNNGGANVKAGAVNFRIGMHESSDYPSVYDIDEFRFLNRAASALEIQSWSKVSTGADSSFGKGCGATLSNNGQGSPVLGNNKYGLKLSAQTQVAIPFLLSLGLSRTSIMNSRVLPLDLGIIAPGLKGCFWESSLDMLHAASLPPSGSLVMPIPIPKNAALQGLTLYSQALLLSASAAKSSNPFAISIH